jgi:hypothetical protein
MEEKVTNWFLYVIIFFVGLYFISFIYHRVLIKLFNALKRRLKEGGNGNDGAEKQEETKED